MISEATFQELVKYAGLLLAFVKEHDYALWRIPMRQVEIEGWLHVGLVAIVLLMWALSVIVLNHLYEMSEAQATHGRNVIVVVGAVLSAVGLPLAILFLYRGLSLLLNPEWHAFRLVMDQVWK